MLARPDGQAAGLVTRTFAREIRKVADDVFEYVLSDATPDRMGDVIEPDGWQLANFKKNPIALFGHDTSFIVGNWRNVRVVDGELRGELALLPPTSDRLREVDAAVQAGVLRAVSVGFRPIKAEPLDEEDPFAGTRFLKQELVEASLVAVGANPNALQIAKSLNLSPQTMSLIFGVQAKEGSDQAGDPRGVQAETNHHRKQTTMTLSEKIEAAQQRVTASTDALTNFVGGLGDLVAGDDTKKMDKLADDVAQAKAALASLQKAESLLGVSSEIVVRADSTSTAITPRPFAVPKAPEPKPGDYYFRTALALTLARATQRPALDILRERYHDDPRTVAMFGAITKASTVPATTTLAGWAAELAAGVAVAEFINVLTAGSVYLPLSARGIRFTFGRNGTVSIPSRAATPTVAGAFIAQGAPIPVKQAGFAAITLTPKKLGVITTATREIVLHSTPAIEGILRQAMVDDTGVAIDTVLVSTSAATATTPPGLRAGVSGQTPTAGGGFNALVGDLKNLIGVLVAANSLRAPVWIANPAQVLSIGLTQNAGGDFPFAAEVNGGSLRGYPIIQSTTVPAGTVILVDAADFASATGDEPQFDVSDQAVLHMEDTTPLPIGTTGSPNTVAAPTRSLWQTDSIGIRLLMDLNWSMRRTGLVAWVAGVTW